MRTLYRMDAAEKDRVVKLGRAIRRARLDQGLSQFKLALMIGTGQSYIYRIEAGRISIGIDKLIRIADALEVDVKSLIDF